MIDLSSNESPYLPSPKVGKEVGMQLEHLNRYVRSEEIRTLKKSMADYCGVSEERILIGPGTDYLFAQAIYRLGRNRNVVTFNPTNLHCMENARYVAAQVVRLQLVPPAFEIDWAGLGSWPGLILFDYPNNPTGQCLINRGQLISLLEGGNHLVLVDEAGYEYCGKTFVDLVPKYPHLAVTRTLNKAFGLAGLRVSWMIAGDSFLEELDTKEVLISRVAYAAALTALEDIAYAKDCAARTISERERLGRGLMALGLEVFSSEANYLLVRAKTADLALQLKTAGFLVEDLSLVWLSGFCRISVGNREENEALLGALSSLSCFDEQDS